jgi:hypothetical protein
VLASAPTFDANVNHTPRVMPIVCATTAGAGWLASASMLGQAGLPRRRPLVVANAAPTGSSSAISIARSAC